MAGFRGNMQKSKKHMPHGHERYKNVVDSMLHIYSDKNKSPQECPN